MLTFLLYLAIILVALAIPIIWVSRKISRLNIKKDKVSLVTESMLEKEHCLLPRAVMFLVKVMVRAEIYKNARPRVVRD